MKRRNLFLRSNPRLGCLSPRRDELNESSWNIGSKSINQEVKSNTFQRFANFKDFNTFSIRNIYNIYFANRGHMFSTRDFFWRIDDLAASRYGFPALVLTGLTLIGDLQLINRWLSRQDRGPKWSAKRRENRVVARVVLCAANNHANRKHVGQACGGVTLTIVDHCDRDNRASRSRIYCYFKLSLGQVSQPWRITISLSGCITVAINRVAFDKRTVTTARV